MTCQCHSCLTPAPQRDRRMAFIHKVHTVGVRAAPGFWDAYAQGYLAALEGRPVTDNPFPVPHMYMWEWQRGHKAAASGVEGRELVEAARRVRITGLGALVDVPDPDPRDDIHDRTVEG